MKIQKKNITPILVILLFIAIVMLFILQYKNDTLQDRIDDIFVNSILDSINGLSVNYSMLDHDEKIRYYYQTFDNLKSAIDVFSISSYKSHDEYLKTLNRLYIYLLNNKNENYEIEGQLRIFEFLNKSLVHPDDSQVFSDFNLYLDEKIKIQEKKNIIQENEN
ncbi:hypothetical protein [Sedimentibacter sp.]|uniref:hypothetical protein n=1 Tax=Sedimentibacter sp. TaxID=1960295 RepID=UPI0028A245CC|nr:hypothetical protein [Sedimentibacter sp.]